MISLKVNLGDRTIVTFQDAIENTEHWFYGDTDRRGLKRSKVSNSKSYEDTYGYHFRDLPLYKEVDYKTLVNNLHSYYDDKHYPQLLVKIKFISY